MAEVMKGMRKRQNPAAVAKARAGNYMADVDTTGMDPAMKSTLAVGKKKKGMWASLAGMLTKLKK